MSTAAMPITGRERMVLRVAEAVPPRIDQPERFDGLFLRFYAEVYGLACTVLGDRMEAEDAAQEVFLKLADATVLRQPEAEVGAWLRRVCLNLSFNRLRGRRRARERLERAGRLEVAEPPPEHGDPAGAALRAEAQADVRRALARLPERQRDCLLLRHSGYAYAEIAETLGIATGSIGVILARAERAFREAYEEGDDERPDDHLS